MDGTTEAELTEFEAIEVESVKGVPAGANGFPHLIMKGVAKAAGTDGQVDEAPDIALGQQIMDLLGRAIGSEAQEISAGHSGETRDVGMLARAADIVSCWIAREQATAAGQDPDAPCGCCQWCSGMGCGCCAACGTGALMCSVAGEAVKAKLSTSAINDLPDSAFAYIEPGGTKDESGKTTPRSKRHFPVHDKAHADDAASRIAQGAKFGDKAKPKVEAAQRKFGEDTSKSAVAEGEPTVQTDPEGTGSLAKAVEDAVTKATGPLKAEIATLREDLAKVKATPIPGGPVMSAVRATQRVAGDGDWAAKAAYYREMAETITDRQSADGYRKLAREADEKAKAAPPATT